MVYLMHSNDNNSAWIADLQFARRTPKTHALTELISTHLEAPFFGELRTNQQLGYIVTSFGNIKDKVLGLSMIVQSDQHPPEEVSKRAFAFIDQMIEGLKQLTDDEFKLYQESIVKKFLEKDKTFEAKLGTLYTEAITLEGQFAYNKLVADEVAKISKTEFIKEFKKSFETQQESSLAIYLYAKGLKSNSFRGTEIKDAQSFKKTAKKYE
jgi:insulysin